MVKKSAVTEINLLSLVGAWAIPMIGGEIDANNSQITAFTRILGMVSITVAFLFIGMMLYYFINVINILGRTERNQRPVDDSGKPIPDNKIYHDSLSGDGKKIYDGVAGLCITGFILGLICFWASTNINEGLIGGSKGWTITLFITGWGSAAITLAMVIRYFIMDIPKLKNADKDTNERYEDDKFLDNLNANKIVGIIMSICYLLPIVGIFLTEFNECEDQGNMARRLVLDESSANKYYKN